MDPSKEERVGDLVEAAEQRHVCQQRAIRVGVVPIEARPGQDLTLHHAVDRVTAVVEGGEEPEEPPFGASGGKPLARRSIVLPDPVDHQDGRVAQDDAVVGLKHLDAPLEQVRVGRSSYPAQRKYLPRAKRRCDSRSWLRRRAPHCGGSGLDLGGANRSQTSLVRVGGRVVADDQLEVAKRLGKEDAIDCSR